MIRTGAVCAFDGGVKFVSGTARALFNLWILLALDSASGAIIGRGNLPPIRAGKNVSFTKLRILPTGIPTRNLLLSVQMNIYY